MGNFSEQVRGVSAERRHCGNRQADHATIARFVRRHAAALQQLFVQVLAVCARDGLVRVDLVAGDGTTVKANASKATNRTVVTHVRSEREAPSWAGWDTAQLLEFLSEYVDLGGVTALS